MSAEKYAQWIVENQDKQGTPEFETVAAAYKAARNQTPQAPQTPQATQEPSLLQRLGKGVADYARRSVAEKANLAAGAVRGAGSIGATLLTPYDLLAGNTQSIGNPERRQAIEEGLRSMGADPESAAFQVGKIGTEIAGTAGAGSALAKGLGMIPGVASRAPALINALRTSGMTTGAAPVTTGAKAANLALRAGAAGTTGALAGGMINPEDAGTAGVISAAIPVVSRATGAAGSYLGQKAAAKNAEKLAKFERELPMRETVKAAIDAGYVVPPNLVNPSTKNALIESFSGKQATSQLASVKNQDITEKLTRSALGLPDDMPLTKGTLEKLRSTAGKAYAEVASISDQAKIDLELLKQARNDAQGWFNAYNRSASPDDLLKAKNFRDMANTLENNLENYAAQAGKEDLIPALREARKQIAKTYTVERALNEATGTVNARVLGRIYEKGKPLSGELETVGRFASAFPSINQAGQQMGSPAAHNLRAMGSIGLGTVGGLGAGVPGLALAALPYATGAASRSLMFRKGAQNALANQIAPSSGNIPNQLLIDLLRAGQLSAPVIAAQ
jgi:ribosomal protein L29